MVLQVIKHAGETRINATTYGNQGAATISALNDGRWVATWVGQDASITGVYHRIYNADGTTSGPDILVNTTTASFQNFPYVTALSDGGYVITWMGNGTQPENIDSSGIFQQRYDASGLAIGGEILVNTTVDGSQTVPRVTALSGGGWVVTWSGNGQEPGNEDGLGTFQRVYSASGLPLGSETRVNTTTNGYQGQVSIASHLDGGWIVAWTGNGEQAGSEDNAGVFLQRYDASGLAVGSETRVNAYALGQETTPSVTTLPDGRWIVTWQGDDASGSGIYMRIYNADGSTTGDDILVNTTTAGWQSAPVVVALADDPANPNDGGWVVTWQSNGIYQQVFKADGTKLGGETLVNTTASTTVGQQSVTALPDGTWIVSWGGPGTQPGQEDDGGVFYQHFRVNNDPTAVKVQIGTSSPAASISISENGEPGREIGALVTTDPDTGSTSFTETFTYRIVDSVGNPITNDFFEIADGTGQYAGRKVLKLKAGVKLNYEDPAQASQTLYIEVEDSGGAKYRQALTITVSDVNEAPTAVTLSATTSALTVGDAAGNLVLATHNDQDTATAFKAQYKFGTNADADATKAYDGLFAIDPATGQVTLTRALAANDVGTKTFTVVAYDAVGNATSETFTLTVNAISDTTAPTDPVLNGGTAIVIDENKSGFSYALTSTDNVTEADDIDFVFDTDGNPGGIFAIDNTDGVQRLVLAPGKTTGDYEALVGHTYTVKVRARDAAGNLSAASVFTITLKDVDEKPTAVTLSAATATLTVGDAAGNLVVATHNDQDTVAAFIAQYKFGTNADADATKAYDGLFAIDPATGQVTVTRALIAADVGAKTFTVIAYDSNGNATSEIFTLTINLPPDTTAPTAPILNGGLDVIVSENTDTFSYALSSDDNVTSPGFIDFVFDTDGNPDGIFAIDNTDGLQRLVLAPGKLIGSYEALVGHTYTVKVKARDAAGNLSAASVLTITVSDVNEAPTAVALSSTVATLAVGDTAGNLVVATHNDQDTVAAFIAQYKFGTNADADATKAYDGLFAIDPATGQVTLTRTLMVTDAGTKTFTVVAYDAVGNATSETFTLTVNAEGNTPPSAPTLSKTVINEYATVGNSVGTLNSTDGNGDPLSYTLVDTSGLFTIDGNELKVAKALNFESAALHKIKILVSDNHGGTAEQVFTIQVRDEVTLIKRGKSKADRLSGTNQDDILKGGSGSGKDTIKGNSGDDRINGEGGSDKLYGGAGLDMFIFNRKTSKTSNFDTIYDFNAADDSIWLDNKVFKKLGSLGSEAAPVHLKASNFAIGKAKDKDDYIIYKRGIIYYDADGKGKGKEVEIVKLANKALLTADDFFII